MERKMDSVKAPESSSNRVEKSSRLNNAGKSKSFRTMSEIVLGPHNGVHINGTRPRRPKTKKKKTRAEQQAATIPVNSIVPIPSSPASMYVDEPAHITELLSSSQWSIERTSEDNYCITIRSVHDVSDFLQVLAELTQRSVLHTRQPEPPLFSTAQRRQHHQQRLAALPYIRYHSELYAKALGEQQPVVTATFLTFNSVLPTVIEDCVHYLAECMNRYYPVRPRKVLMRWYCGLHDPTEDPLALAIGAYWCRHIFIHHRTSMLAHVQDKRILDAIQHKLAWMARDALRDCFDEPHPDRIYALCLLNMTSALPIEQKALYHTIAVQMAVALGISPIVQDNNNNIQKAASPEQELSNRLWWYLFQIDHFLHESGAIGCSMLVPSSDDHDAVSRLLRPTPCSLDEPDEAAGAYRWNHVLALWITRRRLTNEIQATLDSGGDLEPIITEVQQKMDQWIADTPDLLKPERAFESNNPVIAEACMNLGMERCTNQGLLLHELCPTPSSSATLTPLQRKTILAMVECATEMIRLRRTVIQFRSCQTWPGDSKRCAEILMSCVQYKDRVIVDRAKLGLMHARQMLRVMPEVKWQDDICVDLINDIERVLTSDNPVSNNDDDDDHDAAAGRSIKITNNLYTGMMMFDRDLRPREQYYNPAHVADAFTIFEDVSRFACQ